MPWTSLVGRPLARRSQHEVARGGGARSASPVWTLVCERACGSLMKACWAGSVVGLLGVLAVTAPGSAHGFGDRYDLPVPLALWVAGAAIAVVLSFLVIGIFVRGPATAGRYPRINLLRWTWARLLVHHRVWLGAQTVSIALLVLIVTAGVVGSQNPMRNLAPTAIWVVWWVGFAYVSALVGDVWKVVNPWSALFALGERFVGVDPGGEPLVAYPRALGAWPAVLLFGAFAWTELVFEGRAVPAHLALIIVGYSVITGVGMAMFGRVVWLRHGDPFAVAFGLLARFAPTELRVNNTRRCRGCRAECGGAKGECVNCLECFRRAPAAEREWNLRPFAVGLFTTERVSSSLEVFVLLLLASVTFDGFMATPPWATIESRLYAGLPGSPDFRLTAGATVGLVGFAVLFVVVYRAFAGWIARAGGQPSASRIGRVFVLSLVPIALAYHLAHYFSYLLIQGQLAIPLASDPLGFGWNLFGTAGFRPDIGLVDARFTWYMAVTAIVAGHIVAVYVAHVIALREFASYRAVLRSQLVMLLLMVGYTTASLWIIAQPIVESRGSG